VKVDEVGELEESDRTLYVLLGPPPQPITSVEVQEEPRTTRRTKLLQKIYGAEVATLSAISSAAITEEWIDAHDGENPPTEYGAREPMKRAGQALGVTPTQLPQQPKVTPTPAAGPTAPPPSATSVDPPFRWEDIDHRLVILKLTDLDEEMRSQIKADESRIQLENPGNLNRNTRHSLVLKMKEERTDEWAWKVYEVYCDVWQIQGHPKSAAFVRAVYAHGIVPFLRGRTEAIASELSGVANRTGFPSSLYLPKLNAFRLRMRGLEERWRRRLEIEAKECEHAERTNLKTISTSSPENQDHSSVAPQPGKQDTLAGGAPSQARFLPVRSSVPLSEFEATVGKLMVQARSECPTKHLPQAEILTIAALLDDKNLPVRDNLEREASRSMAEYNKQHSAVAIKSWKTALSHPKFRHAVRKRFSRAEEKYRKATPSILAPSAGTPRTTI
jgi:hypothetical protein